MKKRRVPSLSAIRAFEAVGRLNSIVDAASELHVTPTAICPPLSTSLGYSFFLNLRAKHLSRLGLKVGRSSYAVRGIFVQMRFGGKPPAVIYWQQNETTNPDQQVQRVA